MGFYVLPLLLQFVRTQPQTKSSGSRMIWILGAYSTLLQKRFGTAHEANPGNASESTSSDAIQPVHGYLRHSLSKEGDTKSSTSPKECEEIATRQDRSEAKKASEEIKEHINDVQEITEKSIELTLPVPIADEGCSRMTGLHHLEKQEMSLEKDYLSDVELDSEENVFTILWKPNVNLIATKGRTSSPFVSIANGKLCVKEEATIGNITTEKYKLNVSFDELNRTYFIGMCFIDETSLSFVPISGCFLNTLGDTLGFLEAADNKRYQSCVKGLRNSLQNVVQIRVPLKEYRALFRRIEKAIDRGMIIENTVRRYKGFAWIRCEIEEFKNFHMFQQGMKKTITIDTVTCNLSRNWNLYGTAYLLFRVASTPEGLQLMIRFRDFHLRKYRPCLVSENSTNSLNYQ